MNVRGEVTTQTIVKKENNRRVCDPGVPQNLAKKVAVHVQVRGDFL
jgi:hypothetical protein